MRKVRHALITLLLLIAALLGLATLAGFSPAYLLAAPGVGTGIGAKLLCSARYVSGLSREQAFSDLVQYSPILENLTIEYDDAARKVTASLFGLSETSASHLPGLGCTIDYPEVDVRDGGMPLPAVDTAAYWPAGDLAYPPGEAIQALVEDLVDSDNAAGLNTRALAVVYRGDLVAEVYDQGVSAQTPLLGWSMAKSLMSVMLGNLAYRDKLTMSGSPGFHQWSDDRRAAITLPQLLTMTDGLAFSEQYDPGDDATTMLFTEPFAARYVLQKPLVHEPGAHFNYSSGTANLLSLVYFNNTGASLRSSYRDFMENIYVPMAFQHAVFEVDAGGVFMGSSYFYASARDWARIGQLMLNGGVINGRRLVSADWVRKATSPNTAENDAAYGYQWWLNRGNAQLRWPDLPEDAFAAQGNRQQWVMVVPSRETVIVRLGWTAGSYPANQRFAAILDALLEN